MGVIGISGCTSSDINQTTPSYSNNTTTTAQTPVTTSNNTSSSSSDINDSNSVSSGSNSPSSVSDTGTFVGSINSDVYHYHGCSAAKRIHNENLITFNSVTEAKNMGYRPCKICNPPG